MATTAYIFEPQMRKMLEELPVPLSVFQVQGNTFHLLLVSDAFCRLIQFERAEVGRRYAAEPLWLFWEEDKAAVRADMARLLTDAGCSGEKTVRIRRGDGSNLWVHCVRQPQRLADGEQLLYVYYTDVTAVREQQLAQLAAKERTDSLLQRILSTTKTAIFWKDAERRFLGANQAFLDYYGFPSAQVLLGKTDEDMGWHTEPDPYRNDELQVLRGESTVRVHGHCIAHGEDRDIVASKSPMYENGRIVGLVGSFEDVTAECRQREQITQLNAVLQHQMAEREAIMEATHVCIMKLALDDAWTILSCNEAAYALLGYNREDFEREYQQSLQAYLKKWPAEYQPLREAVRVSRLHQQERFQLVMRLPVRTGFSWVKLSGTFLSEAAAGREALYLVCMDVSEAMAMQEQLQQTVHQAERMRWLEGENARLLRAVNHVPTGICVYRREKQTLRCVAVNPYFTKLVGIRPEDISSLAYEEISRYVHPHDRERCRQSMERMCAGSALRDDILRIRHMVSGQYVWLHVVGAYVRPDDGPDLIYLSYTDITMEKRAEQALRDGRRIYERAIEAAHLSVWEYDIRQHCIRFMDTESSRKEHGHFGLDQLIQDVPQSLLPMIDERDQAEFLAMYAAVDRGESASCEVRLMNGKEAELRYERISYIVTMDDAGHPSKAYGIGQNITAQKKAEARYRRELRLLNQANQPNLVAKGHIDLSANSVVEYATNTCMALPFTRGVLYDTAVRQLAKLPVAAADQRRLADMLNRTQLVQHYYNGETSFTLEYKRTLPGQTPMWVSTTVNTFAPLPEHVECFIYTYDVTEKVLERNVTAKLAELGYDFLGIIDVPQRLFVSYSSRFGLQDRTAASHYDYQQEINRKIDHEVPEGQQHIVRRAMALENVQAVLERQATFECTFDCQEADGLHRKRVQCCYLNNSREMIFFCRSDITEQYQHDMEQLQRLQGALLSAEHANEAKSMFLASISHDMRTPLNGILGFTDLALRSSELAKKQDYLKKIKLSGSLLLSLINDTLELSRIESGKFVLDPAPEDSQELLDSLVVPVKASADQKQIRFMTDFTKAPRCWINVDRLKVQEIFLNLLSNAIKFTPEHGTVLFLVEQLEQPIENCNYRILVRDNGIGIGRDFLPKLFEPFSQEHAAEAKNVVGTGLGLSIVKRIVDIMGGRITVQSERGTGTKFTVLLPIQRLTDTERTVTAPVTERIDFTGRKLLLCEDNFLNLEIARTLLEERGFTVATAQNGKEGVDLFAGSQPGEYAAILMDIRMPYMDGYEATAKIRSMNRPDAARVPILAMTADAYEEDVKKCLQAGMNSHIAKPIDPVKLFNELARWC